MKKYFLTTLSIFMLLVSALGAYTPAYAQSAYDDEFDEMSLDPKWTCGR